GISPGVGHQPSKTLVGIGLSPERAAMVTASIRADRGRGRRDEAPLGIPSGSDRPPYPPKGGAQTPRSWAVVSTSHGHFKGPEAHWSASRAECLNRRSPAFQATPEALRVVSPPNHRFRRGPEA